jgi:hypothetical protein
VPYWCHNSRRITLVCPLEAYTSKYARQTGRVEYMVKSGDMLVAQASELRLDSLTKADEVLLQLSRTFDAYMKSIFPFQYEGKVYWLINNYVASPRMRCQVCGNYSIIEVSIIRSEDGQQLRAGNDCIDRLTNRQVSRWFKNYRKKRENVIRNRKYIDEFSLIITASRKNEPASQIRDCDFETLRLML